MKSSRDPLPSTISFVAVFLRLGSSRSHRSRNAADKELYIVLFPQGELGFVEGEDGLGHSRKLKPWGKPVRLGRE